MFDTPEERYHKVLQVISSQYHWYWLVHNMDKILGGKNLFEISPFWNHILATLQTV